MNKFEVKQMEATIEILDGLVDDEAFQSAGELIFLTLRFCDGANELFNFCQTKLSAISNSSCFEILKEYCLHHEWYKENLDLFTNAEIERLNQFALNLSKFSEFKGNVFKHSNESESSYHLYEFAYRLNRMNDILRKKLWDLLKTLIKLDIRGSSRKMEFNDFDFTASYEFLFADEFSLNIPNFEKYICRIKEEDFSDLKKACQEIQPPVLKEQFSFVEVILKPIDRHISLIVKLKG